MQPGIWISNCLPSQCPPKKSPNQIRISSSSVSSIGSSSLFHHCTAPGEQENLAKRLYQDWKQPWLGASIRFPPTRPRRCQEGLSHPWERSWIRLFFSTPCAIHTSQGRSLYNHNQSRHIALCAPQWRLLLRAWLHSMGKSSSVGLDFPPYCPA